MTRIGYDISEWQTGVAWSHVKTDFLFIRATSGYRSDHQFGSHWSQSKGIAPRGAYMYLVGNVPLPTQVNLFTATVGPDKGELPPMLDVEDQTLINLPSTAQRVSLVHDALMALDRWWGGVNRAALYTYPAFMSGQLGNNRALSGWPLDWSNLGNHVAPPWPLTIRQYEISQQPGFPAPIDVNDMTDTAWDTFTGGIDSDVLTPQESAALLQLADDMHILVDLYGNLAKPGALHDINAGVQAIEKNTAPKS